MKKLMIVALLLITDGVFASAIDSVISRHVSSFIDDARAHGMTLTEAFSIRVVEGLSSRGAYGTCMTHKNGDIEIKLDLGFVRRAMRRHDYNAIKLLVYHEMGHGLLKAKHCEGRHIMNDLMFNKVTSFKNYNIPAMVNDLFKAGNQ
jgi:hypothetical protein